MNENGDDYLEDSEFEGLLGEVGEEGRHYPPEMQADRRETFRQQARKMKKQRESSAFKRVMIAWGIILLVIFGLLWYFGYIQIP